MKQSNIILYSTPTGHVNVEVVFHNETFWLTQKRLAKLFGVEVPAISKHLKNIFESGELIENSVISKMETTAADGSAYLDLAESRAERGISTGMKDWIQFLHQFLELSQFPILKDKGKVTALEAKLKAEQEFEEFRKIQDQNYISDFDKEIKRLDGGK